MLFHVLQGTGWPPAEKGLDHSVNSAEAEKPWWCVCVCVCVKVHSRGGAVGVPTVKFLELGDMKSRLASAQVPQLSKHLKD